MYWKISDFVEEIKYVLQEKRLHINTVDGWFKKLEEEQIHYVSRTEDSNEKVYESLDLELAIFIKRKRNEKWSLSAIFNEIKNEFELRPFPAQFKESTNVPQIVDIDTLKAKLIEEFKGTFEEVAAAQSEEIKRHYESLLKQLPKPKSPEEEKEEMFQEMVVKRRVESHLEEEALKMWATKPEEGRFRKTGWFRKEEDLRARDRFVKEYIDKNFADTLRGELGLQPMNKKKSLGTNSE
ncbi:MerR family transcriptional regulator [Bacillus sp. ISL-47]|uniref:MerR family transcriptional regulator n=1 Tax=Bacillus sp. ISL-47 TaxID=2819130 RepID=UPI001BE7312D|nr:MerR family transcriptional regulator [Bacillus sp. ISL-47]MBT2687780.1 MerR family transcriptional regulator [Bacillus sp. ISL-47]MBT2709122.1 hypothetical protein [Pseudomonas sp. ISL-84]